MRWRTEYPVLLNLLVALAVSLVVNFSYLLLLFLEWLLPGIWPGHLLLPGRILIVPGADGGVCSGKIPVSF